MKVCIKWDFGVITKKKLKFLVIGIRPFRRTLKLYFILVFGRYIIIEGLTNFMNGERFLRQEGFLREQPERQE